MRPLIIMELSALKETLGEVKFTELQSYVTTLENQRNEARHESIAGRKALKSEVETLRTVKSKLFDKLGIESDDIDLDSLVIPTKGAELEAAKQFERRAKKLETELQTLRETNTQLDSKYRGTLTDAALAKTLAGFEFVDRDLVTDYVKSRIKMEGDEIVYQEGDKQLSLAEGIKYLTTTKPHLLKSVGASGSGFNPNVSSSTAKSFKQMNLTERAQLFKTNPQVYQQMKVASGE